MGLFAFITVRELEFPKPWMMLASNEVKLLEDTLLYELEEELEGSLFSHYEAREGYLAEEAAARLQDRFNCSSEQFRELFRSKKTTWNKYGGIL